MQGPPVNLVLLGLLIVFFGLQLRRRNEQPYNGWLLGWVLVFLSYLIWDIIPFLPASTHPLEAVRVDVQLLGVVAFLMSFLRTRKGLRELLPWSAFALAPRLLLVDLQAIRPVHTPLYEWLALLSGVSAAVATYKLIPREWVLQRWLLYGLSGVTVVSAMAALRTDPDRYLIEAFLCPMLVAIAILYLVTSRSSPLVRGLGGLGFFMWAGFYAFADALHPRSSALHLLYQFWDLPKYFAGMAMILELFEAARHDTERLAERYRLLSENLYMLYERHPHPMWICDAHSGRILSANTAALQSYGYTLDELRGIPASALELQERELQESSSAAGHGAPPLLAPDAIAPGSRRALHRRRNGDIVSVVVTERSMLFEDRDAIVLLAVDVTEQDKVHQDLFHRAHHDPLTQLPNRELLADRVAQVLARSERDGRFAVLLTIDVDHFKQINDTYGHPVGDECLKLVASRLQSRIRSVDTLARTGGEEFSVIIGGLSRREDAITVAETLRHLFDQPLLLDERALLVTISIGGALFPDDGCTLETLRKYSDEALYRAKRSGRNCCMFAATSMEQTETLNVTP
jgi:diguanylate cyclase (GGDEF)-like protein/PAS domain S-box-containing protein